MKELSIEEKARAYDEALERAKKVHKYSSDIAEIKRMEDIFPELKESEGEKIRKELIEHIKANCESDFILFQKFSPDDILAWLEKQGNPDNKIEPKFHEGDWIVYKNDICQIVKREEGCNKLVTVFGIEKELINERNLSTARLWTIQDAKDGDVLAWDNSKCIALFKNIYDEDSFNSYGFVGHCTGTFESRLSYHDIEGAHPATKEQRDLLFQKMKEAGYEWDAEKKELKRIEQADDFNIELQESENERIRESIIAIINNYVDNSNTFKPKMLAWLESQGEQKPKWTKEDERCIDNCCLLIGAADDCYEKPFKDDCIHYLQSLKERIAPKPKWTDEDEKRLQSCISTLQGKGLMGGVDTINTKWLKSLKQKMI